MCAPPPENAPRITAAADGAAAPADPRGCEPGLPHRAVDPELALALHRVKNALLPISLRVQMLQRHARDDAPPGLRTLAEELELCVRHAVDVVHALSRPPAPSTGVCLSELTAHVLRMAAASLTVAGVTATVDVPAGLVVDGDDGELTSVLVELVTNAIEAMPVGGALSLEGEARATGVWLTVADTGTGMPETVRQRAFEGGFSTKAPPGRNHGRGLGLHGVRRIMERHGGGLGLASLLGEGTKATLFFPHRLAESEPRED